MWADKLIGWRSSERLCLAFGMSEWYYVEKGERQGPISQMEFENRIKDGEILKSTKVWRAGMEAWIPAREVSPNPFQDKYVSEPAASLPTEAPGRPGPLPIPHPASSVPAPVPGNGVPGGGGAAFANESVSELVRPFNRKRGWVITVAIFYILAGGLSLVSALMTVAGHAMIEEAMRRSPSSVQLPTTFFYMLGVVYFVFGAGMIWLSIKLLTGSSALAYAGRTDDPEAVKRGMKSLGDHFLIMAITILLLIITYVTFIGFMVGTEVNQPGGFGP